MGPGVLARTPRSAYDIGLYSPGPAVNAIAYISRVVARQCFVDIERNLGTFSPCFFVTMLTAPLAR
jgi:hypothetical protein